MHMISVSFEPNEFILALSLSLSLSLSKDFFSKIEKKNVVDFFYIVQKAELDGNRNMKLDFFIYLFSKVNKNITRLLHSCLKTKKKTTKKTNIKFNLHFFCLPTLNY